MPALTGLDLAGLYTAGGGSTPQDQVVTQMTALAHGYTRGAGFDEDGNPNADLASVILLAAGRAQNLIYSELTLGRGAVFTYRTFEGWNLAEIAVLNRYRLRAG